MPSSVSFPVAGGQSASGTLAVPSGSSPFPALVLIPEFWGLNAHIQSVADRLAHEGILTLAYDLYNGPVAASAIEARLMMGKLDRPSALRGISAACDYLLTHAQCNGKVAVLGFCIGGALAFEVAATATNLSAVVPFYGVPVGADCKSIKAPVLAHFAKVDDWAKPEIASHIQKQVLSAGGSMELYLYEAGHAFFNDSRPEAYQAESAALAWDRTLAFLRTHLA